MGHSTEIAKVKRRRLLVPQGVEERWTEVQGHRMRYLYSGTGAGAGPPLLLLHGLLGFSFSWSENIGSENIGSENIGSENFGSESLGGLSQRFTVYAPDLLNTGYSDRADLPADLRSMVNQVRDFMDALAIPKADIIASSYGGTIAMALAAIFPERVGRLVLVSPAHWGSELGRNDSGGSERGRWQVRLFTSAVGKLVAPLLRFAPDFASGFFVTRMYGEPARMLPGTIEEYAAPTRHPQTIRWLMGVMRCWPQNFTDLHKLMPALAERKVDLIWGGKDRVVPPSTIDSLRRELPHASLTMMPTAGHVPYEELPAEFNEIALRLLEKGC